MERLTLEDMIKALKCVASQDAEGDCYADHENFNHMEDDNYKRIICGTGDKFENYISGRNAVGCPYHQKPYGTCYEDGELYWLKDVAELLEELKSYKEAEEQGLLVRFPCKVGTEVYYILGIPNKTPCAIDKCVFELSDIDKIGESLFLTREEAEKKLEEMRANGE